MRSRTVFAAVTALMMLVSSIILIVEYREAKPPNHIIDTETTFSIAVFPDTQIYPMYFPDTFINMTEWVVEHRDEYNIQFVLHEGDITNNNNHPQWYNASRAMYVLNGSVPYTLNPGNHDLGPNGNAANRDTYLNDYFPSGPIEQWGSWGGAFEVGHQENTYHYFSAGGRDWMVLALEMGPRDAVLEWANDIVEANPDRLVLMVTHNYMVGNQRMYTLGGNYGIGNSPDGAATGEDIWQEFAKQHRNIICVFSGHILQEWGWLVSNGIHNNPVYQMMVNFQMSGKGGEGFFRLVTFNMETETVNIETYSSLLDETKTVPEHQFSFQFDIFDYVNDLPMVKNPTPVFLLKEDQDGGYLDLDGNLRPNTGVFYDMNVDQGDELKFDVWTGDEWFWVGLGRPLDLRGNTITYMPNGTFELVTPENWFGSFDLKIRARDERGGEVNTSMIVEILSVNDAPGLLAPIYWSFEEPAPVIDLDILKCNEDEPLNFTLVGEDTVEPEDILDFHLFSDEWHKYSFDNETGDFSFTPSNEDVGKHGITFGVYDGTDMTTREILIKVKNVNDPPKILTDTLPAIQEDVEYSFFMEAFDEDPTEDKIIWSLDMEEELLDIDDRTGEISGLAGNDQVGAHEVLITVTDEHGGSDSATYTLIVNNTNDPPYIERTPSTLFMNEDESILLGIDGWFGDIDDEVLSYSLGPIDHISVELLENNSIRIIPEANWSGSGTIEMTASDGEINVTDSFQIVVEQVNDAPFDPSVEVDRTTVIEGEAISATASATDVDLDHGDELTFAWFSNRTGSLGVGNNMDLILGAGHHLITMTVTDKGGEFAKFDIELYIEQLPVNDTDDDDNDGSDDKEKGDSSMTVIMIIIPIAILILVGIGILLFLMKRKEEPDEPDDRPENTKDNTVPPE